VITSSQVSISEDRVKVSVAIGVSVVCWSLCILDCKPACQFRVLLKRVFFLLFTEACSDTLPFRWVKAHRWRGKLGAVWDPTLIDATS
jgi:hypothetical protein